MQIPRKVIVMGVIAGSALLGLLLTLDSRPAKPMPADPVPVLLGDLIPEPTPSTSTQVPTVSTTPHASVTPVQSAQRSAGVVDSVYRGQTVTHVPVETPVPAGSSTVSAPALQRAEGSAAGPSAPPATSAGPGIALEDMIVCRDVERESRTPVDAGTSFSAKGGKVTCWVRILNGQGRKIRHLWLLNGRTYAGVWLSIGSSRWRTWGSKTITPGMVGPAEVSIEDDAGMKLGSAAFTITP